MDWSLREWLVGVFGPRRSPESETNAGATGRDPATLHSCRRCDNVYISEALDSCSGCGGDVEPIPNGRDLGIAAGRGGR